MNRSEQIGDLVAALALAKSDYLPLKKSKFNPFFKSQYADLSDVIEATEGALAKNGIVIIQGGEVKDSRVVVTTLLAHKSGQWIESLLSLKPAKDDAQGVGSTMTYGQRYSWQAIVGITGEPDDDGNAASPPAPQQQVIKKTQNVGLFSKNNEDHLNKLISGLMNLGIHDQDIQDHRGQIACLLDGKPFTKAAVDDAIKAVVGK